MVRVDGRPLHIAGQPSSDLPEHRNTPVTIEFQTKQPIGASNMGSKDGCCWLAGLVFCRLRISPVQAAYSPRRRCVVVWCNYGCRLWGALQRQAEYMKLGLNR
jgi:hypothetical protein